MGTAPICDARIVQVYCHPDGTATICLLPDDDGLAPYWLTVVNPPSEDFDACVDTRVWGGNGYMIVRQKLWAESVSDRAIRLVEAYRRNHWKREWLTGGRK